MALRGAIRRSEPGAPAALVLWLLAACVIRTSGKSSSGALERLQASCRKTLWLVGADLKANSSFLDEGAKVYAEHLLVALRSAKSWAPSLVPVVILHGDANQTLPTLVARIERAGAAAVLFHHLSFEAALQQAIGKAARSSQLRHGGVHLSAAYGTFLRVDLPYILPKVLSSPVVSALVQKQLLDADYVLWTDPDVMFFKDITSCTLPKPPLLSIGADLSRSVRASCGVIYFNVSSYTRLFADLLKYAEREQFKLLNAQLDQGVMISFLGEHTTMLPDIYNYKPYWGTLPSSAAPPASRSRIAILHIQGPKLAKALCVLDHLAERFGNKGTSVDLAQVVEALAQCVPDVEEMRKFDWTTKPLVEAFNTDGGALYRAAAQVFKDLIAKAA